MVRSLVIGANGFIGSHLVDALAAAGHEVTAFDRFSTLTPTFGPGPRILAGDFLNRRDLDEAVTGQDYVFHFLSTTTPATAESDPTLDIRTNVAQSVELLESCVEAQVSHVFYSSTGGAIYGPQGLGECAESDRAMPISPYGIGKLTVERYLDYFRARHGLRSTALRVSNPYGPRQRANRKQGLIPIALRQIALGEPVTQYGDGSMVRDYIYVDDLVRMVAAMVDAQPAETIYNVGSGQGHTVSEIFAAIARVTGEDFQIVVAPKPATFVDRVVLNTDRYRAEFGDIELTGLDEGIALTYHDIRAGLGG